MTHETDKPPVDPAELVAALREYATRIPHYTHLTNEEAVMMRKAASLDEQWIVAAINLLGASPTIERALGSSAAELQDELAGTKTWSEGEQEARALLHGITSANLVRRHAIGLKALQIYGIAQQLIREPAHQDLLTHVEKLKQMNKMRKRKGKEEEGESSS
ncbi:MAG TPA: hypothetical protein VE974_10315 [Thermoanaerobaculia bacterium]|nr:hypothetical protein [Thermoanaerobaculia bacterium]